jgi:hypothetical protein
MSGLIFSKHQAGPATFYLRRGGQLEVHVNGMVLAVVPEEAVERRMLDKTSGVDRLAEEVAAGLPHSLDINFAPVCAWLRMWQLCNYLRGR